MTFEKYKPNARSREAAITLNKTTLSFNIPAAKLLKWERVNIAVDRISGQIAISEAAQNGGLAVSRQKKWDNAVIASTGIIKSFSLERFIGRTYTILDKKDMLLLTPKAKAE